MTGRPVKLEAGLVLRRALWPIWCVFPLITCRPGADFCPDAWHTTAVITSSSSPVGCARGRLPSQSRRGPGPHRPLPRTHPHCSRPCGRGRPTSICGLTTRLLITRRSTAIIVFAIACLTSKSALLTVDLGSNRWLPRLDWICTRECANASPAKLASTTSEAIFEGERSSQSLVEQQMYVIVSSFIY